MKKLMQILLCASLLTAAVAAQADIRLVYVDENSGAVRSVIAIKDGMVRMDNKDEQNWMLYDSDSKTITVVDVANRSYSEIDNETMQKVAAQVTQAMAQLEKQLASVPPEQREAMKKMMGGMMDMGKEALKTSVERTGRSMTKAGHDCEEVIFTVGTITRTTLCIVDASDAGVDGKDHAALRNMFAAMSEFTETVGEGIGMSYSLPDIGGIPVYTKEDKESSAEILKEADDSALSDELFAVPSGYSKQEMNIEQ